MTYSFLKKLLAVLAARAVLAVAILAVRAVLAILTVLAILAILASHVTILARESHVLILIPHVFFTHIRFKPCIQKCEIFRARFICSSKMPKASMNINELFISMAIATCPLYKL